MNRFEFLKKIKLPKLGRLPVGQIIFWGVTLALSVGIFVFARNLTFCWNLTGHKMPASCGGAASPDFNPEGTPNAVDVVPPTPGPVAPEVALPPAWDGASRINILFIGLDYRDWQVNEGPPRSDTMILFTVDPLTKTAGMLSIPRDLWVNIPGYGYSRINTAYASGEANKLPGGGAGLAMKTVEQVLGVPVHYYAQVDFNTFTEIVNRLGCITIIPEETLILDPVGEGLDHVKIT
ncbi:MAG: LCP family protein, partial [Anaerolineales bacterium]|nr:LCP family protein [Anaerolineales bacterium]